MVLAPEHPFVRRFDNRFPTCRSRSLSCAGVAKKSDLERTELAKEKTGVFTGCLHHNPVNDEKIPIWIADYVLASYGTGAIMAVPAHDERDFEFALKYRAHGLTIIPVVMPDDTWLQQAQFRCKSVAFMDGQLKRAGIRQILKGVRDIYLKECWLFEEAFTGNGVAINSGFINGLPTSEAKQKIIGMLESQHLGKKFVNYKLRDLPFGGSKKSRQENTNYKLRDWLFSRQRYWGEPFPIVWKKDRTLGIFITKRCRNRRCPFFRRNSKITNPRPMASPHLLARRNG